MFSDTDIFEFDVNGNTRKCDPLAALRKMHELLDVEKDALLFDELGKDDLSLEQKRESLAAQGRMAQAARQMFNLKSFEEDGTTDAKALLLLVLFWDWLLDVKKNMSELQTVPPSTVVDSSEA